MTTKSASFDPAKKPLVEAAFYQMGAGWDVHQCGVCKLEARQRCLAEHPDWFTPARKEPKSRFEYRIETYVRAHTPHRRCLVITDHDAESVASDNRCYVCVEHLQLVVDYLRDREHGAGSDE